MPVWLPCGPWKPGLSKESSWQKTKLTKSAVGAEQPRRSLVELRYTLVPGFLCKVTPAGREVFTLQYRTNARERLWTQRSMQHMR